MNFSEKLYTLRKKSGLSQEQLAENLGVSRQAISKWESGHAVPETDKLLVISEYFEVSLDYLLKDSVQKELSPSQQADILISTESTKRPSTLFPGLGFCITGIVCLIIWGLVTIISPEASAQISQSSMIQLDGNGILLLISLAAIVIGAGLLLKNLHKK